MYPSSVPRLYHLIEHETAHRGEIGEMRRLAEQDIF